jgi:hypothetical protein
VSRCWAGALALAGPALVRVAEGLRFPLEVMRMELLDREPGCSMV